MNRSMNRTVWCFLFWILLLWLCSLLVLVIVGARYIIIVTTLLGGLAILWYLWIWIGKRKTLWCNLYFAGYIGKSTRRTKNWLVTLSFWIPRKYREAIVGDIIEDCHELRALGKSEWRIRIHVIWQVIIALILLRPVALMDAFKRIWSTK